MRVILEVTAGPHAGHKKSLRDSSSVRVGRTDEAGFVLAKDQRMSRVHFAVECIGGECVLVDLKSTNGTFVNGERVGEKQVLKDGDQIKAGQSRFVVRIETAAVGGDAPPPTGNAGWGSPDAAWAPEPWPSPMPPGGAPAPASSPPVEESWGRPIGVPIGPTSPGAPYSSTGWPEPQPFALPPPAPPMPATGFRGPSLGPAPVPSPAPPSRPRPAPPPLAAAAGAATAAGAMFPPYDRGFGDENPAVRREALWAALWKGERRLMEHCRAAAREPNPSPFDALWLLAVLGQPADLPLLMQLGQSSALGSRRFDLLGAFGHPGAIEILLAGLSDPDPVSAEAAALAFEKITGLAVARSPAADGAGVRPNSEQARGLWAREHSNFARAARWSRGIDVSKGDDPEALLKLDLVGRREAFMRGCYWSRWPVGPWKLDAYPQAGR